MNLASTDFELFEILPRFRLDRNDLDSGWRALQARVHPDRFVAEGVAAQRIGMQWAVRVNEAYERLKSPVRRASYLCELNGVGIDAEENTAMPGAFLMQQMAWREALAEARTASEVEVLADEVALHRTSAVARLQSTLDDQHDFAAAAQQVRALMFVERFSQDIDRRIDALDL